MTSYKIGKLKENQDGVLGSKAVSVVEIVFRNMR